VTDLLTSTSISPPPRPAPPRILDAKWDGRDTFTIPEAGEICGLSRASAYQAAKTGALPVVWIGRRGIVPRHALEKLLGG
jgi:hypothetical protein